VASVPLESGNVRLRVALTRSAALGNMEEKIRLCLSPRRLWLTELTAMTGTLTLTWNQPHALRVDPGPHPMTDEEFFAFCQLNAEWRIERTAEGELIIMPPAGGGTSKRNLALAGPFDRWVEADGTGVGFDSSGGFILPNGATRSPDLAWVERARWEALSAKEQEEFLPLCPDFVVELRSRTDRLAALQDKMEEYLTNGARLGWLIDPSERKVYIYRPGAEVVSLDNPTQVAGDPLLPGFVLDLGRIWS
jgi:Uma2 family endonuclease